MENLANPETGNVAGMCSGGNCEFNFSQNVVSGMATSSTNISQSFELSETAKANIEAGIDYSGGGV